MYPTLRGTNAILPTANTFMTEIFESDPKNQTSSPHAARTLVCTFLLHFVYTRSEAKYALFSRRYTLRVWSLRSCFSALLYTRDQNWVALWFAQKMAFAMLWSS